MKRNFLKLSAILTAVVVTASCQREDPETDKGGNEGDKQEQVGETITLEITAEGQWTDSDVLGVRIPSVNEHNKAASFENGKFKASVKTPAKDDVVYAYIPFTPTADGKFGVNLPAAVAGNDGTAKAKVAVPVTLGEITDPTQITVSMKDVFGTIQLNISDLTEGGSLAGQAVTSLTVTSDSDIAGHAAIDIMSGEAVLSEPSKTVTVTPTEGTVLGSSAVVLKISALPGTYTGTVRLATTATEYELPLNATVTAGQTAQVELSCTAAEYKGIQTVEDWNAFIEGIKTGNYNRFVNPETGEVELMASLTFEETPAYPATEENALLEFNGKFNGNNNTITCNAFTRPLFNVLGKDAEVKSLTVNGSFKKMLNAGLCGNAVIAKVNKGLIENVTSNVETNLEISTGFIFGAICGQNGGTLKMCRNTGNITLTYASTGSAGLYGGGLAAIGHTVSGEPTATTLNIDDTCAPGLFVNCENSGNISITATAGVPVRQGFGGICGLVYFNGVKFEGCKNTGNISRISNGESSNNKSSSIGGILGRSAAWYTTGTGDSGALDTSIMGFDTEIAGCSNSGTLYCCCRHSGGISATGTSARTDGVGGIAGTLIGNTENTQKVTNCTNTGEVSGGWNADVNTVGLGGLVGIASHTEISGSSAICRLSSKETEFIGAAGGLVACVMDAVTVKGNCVAIPTIDAYAHSTKTYFYGLIFGNVKGTATVTGTSVGGSIKADGTDLGITSENFTSHLVSDKSNSSIPATGVTWKVAQ